VKFRWPEHQNTLSKHINLKHTSDGSQVTGLMHFAKQGIIPSTKHPDLWNGHTIFSVNIFKHILDDIHVLKGW